MKFANYFGHECCVLENSILRLLIARDIGPRILSFGFANGENIFAELPDFTADLSNGKKFYFYGGHRLWIAPENFDTTYIPDDEPVDISELDDGLLVTQPTRPETDLQKSIEIRLKADSAHLTLTHRITNHGNRQFTCALWAITQLKINGMAILPQTQSNSGFLPNRTFTLWSYTDIGNPKVKWGNRFILVNADMTSPFKIGFPNLRGWLAYWLDGTLFVKQAAYDQQSSYYDSNSSSECYCNDQFLELETLAPITSIAPGQTALHEETWTLYKDIECVQNEEEAEMLVKKLGLG